VIITDKLKSYSAARVEVMPSVEHPQQKYQNNRAEKFASTNQVAGASDEAIQVSWSGSTLSLSFRGYNLPLLTRAAPLYRRRL